MRMRNALPFRNSFSKKVPTVFKRFEFVEARPSGTENHHIARLYVRHQRVESDRECRRDIARKSRKIARELSTLTEEVKFETVFAEIGQLLPRQIFVAAAEEEMGRPPSFRQIRDGVGRLKNRSHRRRFAVV